MVYQREKDGGISWLKGNRLGLVEKYSEWLRQREIEHKHTTRVQKGFGQRVEGMIPGEKAGE